jgi:hypothetical protein
VFIVEKIDCAKAAVTKIKPTTAALSEFFTRSACSPLTCSSRGAGRRQGPGIDLQCVVFGRDNSVLIHTAPHIRS